MHVRGPDFWLLAFGLSLVMISEYILSDCQAFFCISWAVFGLVLIYFLVSDFQRRLDKEKWKNEDQDKL
jgi:membrane protein implicated in regulation of membrane protease activity